MRPAPPFESDQFYHVYNRGNNREALFKEPRNYRYFLSLWAKHLSPVIDTAAYALMPNHFHVVVRVRRSGGASLHPMRVSRAFANCFSAYALAINRAYGRSGSLFQEHLCRKWIDADRYLHNAICYVHTNPQNHGFVSCFSDYAHTSYHSLLSAKPTALMRSWVMEFFGGAEAFVHWHRQYATQGFPDEGLFG